MSDLAGFAVLSAGPLGLLAALLLGILAVWIAVRTQKTRGRKWIAAGFAAVIVILVPTWDVILGRVYFNYLCVTSAGIKVYKHINLGPEYRDIQFPQIGLQYERLSLAKQYPYRLNSIEDLPGPAKIKMVRESIIDARNGEALGDITKFFYGGGWFENATSLHGAGGGSCVPSGDYFKAFLEEIFRRS